MPKKYEENVLLPPNNSHYEEQLLASIMICQDVKPAIDVGCDVDDFFTPRNKDIFDAMLCLYDRNEVIDNTTVIREIEKSGHKNFPDGAGPTITYLVNNCEHVLRTEQLAQAVHNIYRLRKALGKASEIAKLVNDDTRSSKDIFVDVQSVASDILHIAAPKTNTLKHIKDAAGDFFGDVSDAIRKGEMPSDIFPFGFKAVDKILKAERGNFVILAAPPGAGKTSFAISSMINMAKQGKKVLFMSIEMRMDEILQRMFAIEANIPIMRLKEGKLSDNEFDNFVNALGTLASLDIWIDDNKHPTLIDIEKSTGDVGPDLIVIDYMQQIDAGLKGASETQEVSYIAKSLNRLGDTFDAMVIALSQLNREYGKRKDKRPTKTDLLSSGWIEREADCIIFIYRDDLFDEESERPNQAEIIIDKQRNGPTGTAMLYFQKEKARFTNLKLRYVDLNP